MKDLANSAPMTEKKREQFSHFCKHIAMAGISYLSMFVSQDGSGGGGSDASYMAGLKLSVAKYDL